ncbi:MAG: aspartate aminotransferase family protein [Cryobacterium sp.]|nr:aspartate aminotransferase family protein [Oligoflexia bacterium]
MTAKFETNPTQPKHQKAVLRTEVPGPQSRALREQEDRHLAPGLQGFALMSGMVVEDARGSAVTDIDGNTYLDIIGGIGVNGLGHSHPRFVNAVKAQVEKASVGSFTSRARVELFETISKNRPSEKVHRTQLYSSGAEAVESALRLAKCATGKTGLVSFWGGFHGKTMGALSLMGSDFKDQFGPFVPDSHTARYPHPYHCPEGMNADTFAEACLDDLRKHLKGTANTAAIIVEPMQGTAGNVIPSDSFLPGVASIAKEVGALLIVDEMITGFGRTGKYWGLQHSGVTPDIVTLGKQFGGGFPISALISTDEITSAKPWSNPSGSSSSYGGNPLAAAAANESLKIIAEENLVENSRVVGAYFLEQLKPFADRYPFIGEARGRGLFLALEMVKDKRSKQPLTKPVTNRIFGECLKRGLLTMAYASSFRIQPAMTIDKGTVDEVIQILREVFDFVEKDGFWKV